MRSAFIETLLERARTDKRIVVVTPDLGFSVLEPFKEAFPERFINAGIAEQSAVGVASGLALGGFVPYVYSIIPFAVMRCYEQIRVDAAYMKLPVRIVGVGAGLTYGAQGATHHALEDVALMRALPNMTVCSPGDPIETRLLTRASFDMPGPMYIRLGKNGERALHSQGEQPDCRKIIQIIAGEQLAVLATGPALALASDWVQRLRGESAPLGAALMSVPTIKPLDTETVSRLVRLGRPIITIEEHSRIGGLGSAVAEWIAENGAAVPFKRMGLPDSFMHDVGSQSYLRERAGLTYEAFYETVKGVMS
ncbi:Apulose-4-phosphate transketolase subunit B [Paenibacillus plantiphilus]|uniref:Apulose-4-phosphate transketolase subunit B n=1 Tax=Paenibacillus plantiphilus TaxID=2905650 RepID=A0ABM9CNA5_9BACL|nr:transketolase C-terminal domain-containing protein [Paenibacillus plantiphilus]CAH1218385.1 Apulose-4-phosphate transketolase subunit B [Paenibacillus plantiphilus]